MTAPTTTAPPDAEPAMPDRAAEPAAVAGDGLTDAAAPASARTGAVLATLSLAASSLYLLAGGVGYVLDDWFALGNAHFGGAWTAAGAEQWRARPGAGVTYAFSFGLLEGRPLAAFAFLATIGATTAVLFWLLLRRFVPERFAFVAALVWIVLPNHTSLEFWISATNISLSVLLVLAGTLVVLTPTTRRIAVACLLFAAASLSYEAVMPIIAALVVVLPWLLRGRPDVKAVASVGVTQVAVAGWIVSHWHSGKALGGTVDLSQVPAAHFGWGVLPVGPVATLAMLLVLVVLTAHVARLLTRRFTCGPVEWAVPVGLGVIALGVLPFVRYLYAPLGAGDRFNVVSSFGGAILWAVVFETLRRVRRELAVGAFAVVLAFGLATRWDRSQLWSDAASDGVAIQAAALDQVPVPGDHAIVVGPKPVQIENIAVFLDPTNIQPALQLAYGDESVRAYMATTVEEFESTPAAERVDTTGVTRLGTRCNAILRAVDGCANRP